MMTRKLRLYHGTTAERSRQIMQEGFKLMPGNWEVPGRPGFAYLSDAYAPFYAMQNGETDLVIILIEAEIEKLYPDDDWLMSALGKKRYEKKDLDTVDFEQYKQYWKDSLRIMGCVSVRYENAKPLIVREFDGQRLILICDPIITAQNYWYMGGYYKWISDMLFESKSFKEIATEIPEMRTFMPYISPYTGEVGDNEEVFPVT